MFISNLKISFKKKKKDFLTSTIDKVVFQKILVENDSISRQTK